MSKLIVTTIEDASGASGTVTFTGSVQAVDFNSTSDARLKTEVNTITDGLEKISQMRGVTFKIHEKPSAGVIAQELEKVIPAAVSTGDNDYKSVNYNTVIGYLIEAVKELQEEVNTLKGQ
tara:strand:- start:516 stop:875 length:360 start_codon:yes stop_codon:yes gene_type:complete